MFFTPDKLDALYCQKVQEAIHDPAPCILSIFCNDSFENDAYLELRYQPARGYADLYFCGISLHQIISIQTRRALVQKSTPCTLDDLLQKLDLTFSVNHARICSQSLSYILAILDDCQGVHSTDQSFGRDGCWVTVKSFWKDGAEFNYWVRPKGPAAKIAGAVWLLADYLPRPARDSLQSCLSSDEVCQLQKKLTPASPASDDSFTFLQAVVQKGDFHAEN